MRLFIVNEESERLINSAACHLNVDEIFVQFSDYKTTNNYNNNNNDNDNIISSWFSDGARAAYYLAYGFEIMHKLL